MPSLANLSRQQIEEFHEKGFLGPLDLFSEREARRFAGRIGDELEDSETDLDNLEDVHPLASRHLDCQSIYDLCTRDQIVDQMTDIYGENLILWESKLFYKQPGGAEIPWHQHYHHMPITPKTSVTAWIALSDCTEENGCLEFVPGSNEKPLSQVSTPEGIAANEMADPEKFDEEQAVEMEMRAGQYVLFSETVLHRSSPNESDATRRAVAARASPSHVNLRPEMYGGNPDIENHTAILLSGMDEHQVNELVTPEFY